MNKVPRFVKEFMNYQLREVERIYKNDEENIVGFYKRLNTAVFNYERGLLTMQELITILNDII